MYTFARLLLQCSMVAVGYSFVLLMIYGWPTTAIPLVLGGLALACRKREVRLTTLGSARWAESDDLGGMLEAKSGLILGRIPVNPSKRPPIATLFDLRIKDKRACQEFFKQSRQVRWELVRLQRAIHIAAFAPTSVGKNVSLIFPFLLDCDESVVVIDFKGENHRITAEHRRKVFGHRIVTLDPYGVVTKTPDCFNPLDRIAESDPQALDECHDLAEALVIRTGDEPERHWNDSAEAWISAMLATAVCHGRPYGARSLQAVRDMLSSPASIAEAIQLMRKTREWDGMLARMGGQLTHYVDREKSSVLTTVSRHLRFLDSPAIAASTMHSSFNPAELLGGKLSVYLILPPEDMRAQSSLLRMWIGGLLRAVVRGGLRTKGQVHFVLDEAASLGHLEALDDAIDKFRGYGVRLQFYFQSVGQLRKCFPNGQDQTLLSNTTQIYFGVNDGATAELVSTRLGEQTIVVDSWGTSAGHSSQNTMGEHPSQSSGQSFTRNANRNQVARRLLKPEEVMALPPRAAITFTPGVPPICTELLRYYEEPNLGRREGRAMPIIRAGGTLFLALACFFASIAIALLFTVAAAKAGL